VTSQAREHLTRTLIERLEQQRYPSITQMERLEGLIADRQMAERYLSALVKVVERDQYPSVYMLDHITELADFLEQR
jgi:predicted transcriptional regulator